MTRVLIGLGSNLDPERNMAEAARMLRERWPGIRFSSVYATAPREVEDQPDFLNAAAAVETDDAPELVAAVLREIEHVLKKAPAFRFGPRTIDLDLLLYGERTVETKDLAVPHPRMHERKFVLEPLLELGAPGDRHPVLGRPWTELLAKVAAQETERTAVSL